MNRVTTALLIMLVSINACSDKAGVEHARRPSPAELATTDASLAERKKRYHEDNDHASIGHIVADVEYMSARRTVESEARKKRRTLDLTPLNTYGAQVTKEDLIALSDPACASCLKELTMKYVSFSPDALEALARIPLETLDLAHSKGEELRALSSIASLRKLSLASMPLTGSDYKVLGAMTNLRSLDLASTNISDRDLPSLYVLKNLVVLDLSRCSNVSEKGLANLRQKLSACEIRYGQQVNQRRNQRSVLSDDLDDTSELIKSGRFKEAEQPIRDNIGFLKSRRVVDYDRLIHAYVLLAESLTGQASSVSGSSYASQAGQAYEAALEIGQEHDRLEQLQKSLNSYALFFEMRKKMARAIEIRRYCQQLSEQHPDRTHSSDWNYHQRDNLSRLAADYRHENQLDRAAATYEEAANLAARSLSSENSAVNNYLTARNLYSTTKNFLKSNACRSKAKKVIEKIESRCAEHWSCESCLVLAERYFDLSERSESSEIKKSHQYYEQVIKHNCAPLLSCQALIGLGRIDQAWGKTADALAHVEAAKALSDKCGNLSRAYKALSLIEIGRIDGNQCRYKSAIDALAEADTLLVSDSTHEAQRAEAISLKDQFSSQLCRGGRPGEMH
jgi:tetratricopeptide (TPR) repeat protein